MNKWLSAIIFKYPINQKNNMAKINMSLSRRLFNQDMNSTGVVGNCYWENFGKKEAEIYTVKQAGTKGDFEILYLSKIHRGLELFRGRKTYEECSMDLKASSSDLIILGKSLAMTGKLPEFICY